MHSGPKLCKVLVTGGRDYNDARHIGNVLRDLAKWKGKLFIIEGGAQGCDTLCRIWAEAEGHYHATVPALWKHLGKAAGGERNTTMLELYPHLCLAFPGGTGTADMKRKAKLAGLEVYEV